MSEADVRGLVLVVDDDPVARMLHRNILAKKYDVVTADSGAEALAKFAAISPDLVLMDAEMPDIDGYQACSEIRDRSGVPVIFATANTDLEEHMRAYDSGGTGLIVKPINAEILIRKVATAIARYRTAQSHVREKFALQQMAMSFLSNAGQNGALLNFMRTSIACPTYEQLAKSLTEACNVLGMNCFVRITAQDGSQVMQSSQGEVTALEQSILDHVSGLGRIFEFRKRLAVNYDRVTIVLSNFPEDAKSAEAGMMRDNVAILAETAQALSENIDLRVSAARQAEQMQLALMSTEQALDSLGVQQRQMLADVRVLLQEMVDGVEQAYGWLGTSQDQEATISGKMESTVERILTRLLASEQFEIQLRSVRTALSQGYERDDAIQLF